MKKHPGNIIKRPRVTEKATISAEQGAYVFEVFPGATKIEISKAIKELYSVVPAKIRVAAIPTKQVIVRGSRGRRGGGKKAYVYLKKGDKIEIV